MGFLIGMLVFFPFLGGLVCSAAGKRNEKVRDCLAAAVTILELSLILAAFIWNREAILQQSDVWNSAVASLCLKDICGMGLNFQLDGFRLIYGMVAAFMWTMACLMSKEYLKHHENRNRFYLFLLLTLGATMGVFLSADLFTT
ncbi:MAG: sodium:proton antiporter, partial [Eubacteriales bacterium]|nr:sodium:proton antiporter [Eubacteriales bacterium]